MKSMFVDSAEVYRIGDRRYILIGNQSQADHKNKSASDMERLADIVINDKNGEVEKNRGGSRTKGGF